MNLRDNSGRLAILALLLLIILFCLVWASYAEKANENKRTNGVMVCAFYNRSVL